jgi:hypothetical protein
VQGILKNAGVDNDYSLRFTPQAVWTTFRFYVSKILLAPWAGLALIPAAWLARDARVRFGLLAIPLMLGPLWFLPGRLFAVYLYLPLTGLALALAFASERWRPWALPVLFALWLPWNYQLLREGRRAALTTGPENREFVEQTGAFARKYPDLPVVLYDGGPAGMNEWGVRGALRWFYRDGAFRMASANSSEAKQLLDSPGIAIIGWDRVRRRLITAVRSADEPDIPYIEMAEGLRVWQFGEGWYPIEGGFRWTGPRAFARLRRPAGAREFEVRLNVGPLQFADQGGVALELFLDGVSQGVQRWDREGWHARRWAIAPSRETSIAQVELRAVRPYRASNGDPRLFGAAVAAFGFVAP